jgi:archaellum biogenesis ATPase FlaH
MSKEIEANEMDMEVIASLKKGKKEFLTKINAWEEEKKQNAKISIDSFKSFITKDNVANVGETLEILFERYKSFNQQLVEDFE